MLKEIKDFIKAFISEDSKIEFSNQTYTEHGMIALGRKSGMTEGELKVLLESIHRIEKQSKKAKTDFVAKLSSKDKGTNNVGTQKGKKEIKQELEIEENSIEK